MAGNHQDYRDILQTLNEAGVDYLVVGAYAVMFYTEPRYTKDLDIWVRNTPENANAVYKALLRFGAPVETDAVTPHTFTEPDLVYQIGVAPVRIDLSTSIDGVEFEAAWAKRIVANFFGVPVNVISLADLVHNKESTGRPEDSFDARRLKEAYRRVGCLGTPGEA